MSKDGETRKEIAQEALIKLLVRKGIIKEEELLEEIEYILHKIRNLIQNQLSM